MNSNSSSDYTITSEYNSELINDSCINNYKEEEEEEKNNCCWSREEEQIFQNALAETDSNSPTFYEDLARRIPWKYIHEIKQHYRELIGETDSSGHVPDEKEEEKMPILMKGIIPPSPPEIIKNVVCTHDKSTKNVPWTEQEHQLFLMGLEIYGKGKWKFISKFFVKTRTPAQVASHAQKFFARHRKLDNNNGSKRPRVNKVRRHSIFDNTDPYFLPDSQESYSYPPPPPLHPPPVVVQNHHPPNDHQNNNIDQNTIPCNHFFPQNLESSFPGVGNTYYDEPATGPRGTRQPVYNPNKITTNFLPSQIMGGGEVFSAQTDDHHPYHYNPSSSSPAGSSNGNNKYQGAVHDDANYRHG